MTLIANQIAKLNSAPSFVQKGKWMFGLRKIFKKYYRIPIVVSVNNANYYLSSDPIDDIVFHHITENYNWLYFPNFRVSQNPIIIDAGGHHGYYSVYASTKYENPRIYSFEPDMDNFRILLKNVNINKNIIPISKGVSDSDQSLYIVKSEEGSWGNYISEQGDLEVEMVDIYAFCEKQKISQIDIIKLNIEGGEYKVLPRLIEKGIKPKNIILFIHPEHSNGVDLQKYLLEHNYEELTRREDEYRPTLVYQLKQA